MDMEGRGVPLWFTESPCSCERCALLTVKLASRKPCDQLRRDRYGIDALRVEGCLLRAEERDFGFVALKTTLETVPYKEGN
jgi:hypothetical protein